MSRTVKIFYDHDETGPAEMVGKRTAVILDTPILNIDLCKGSIVLLDRNPYDCDGFACIKKILHNPYCHRTYVQYHDEAQAMLLHSLFCLLDAVADPMFPPKDDKPGVMIVSHHDGLDPELLAISIGIEQPDDDPGTEGGTAPKPSDN